MFKKSSHALEETEMRKLIFTEVNKDPKCLLQIHNKTKLIFKETSSGSAANSVASKKNLQSFTLEAKVCDIQDLKDLDLTHLKVIFTTCSHLHISKPIFIKIEM